MTDNMRIGTSAPVTVLNAIVVEEKKVDVQCTAASCSALQCTAK